MSDKETSSHLPRNFPSPDYIPPVAMIVHAHPDDQEFSTAGTLARWSTAGSQVISVMITSGEAGSNLAGKDERYKPELAKLREAEQVSANAVLGVAETIFLHYPDGTLQPSLDLRRDLDTLDPQIQTGHCDDR